MKKSIILTIAIAMALTACDNFLTPDNKTTANQEASTYFSNDPSELRVYAYSLLKPVAARVDVYEEGVDLYMASNKKTGTKFDQYTVTPEDKDVKSLYADLYSCINMANACIYYDADKQFTAEMQFLRSYCYYVLTQQFGSVPYITDYINTSSRSYPKTELTDIYTALIEELTTLTTDANLPATANNGTVSQQAAKALLAKVYLAAGWDLHVTLTDALQGTYTIKSNEYFQKAYNYAKEVADAQALTMSFEDKWSPANEGNTEVIFAVQYDRAGWKGDLKTGGHGLQNTFGSYYGDCTSTGEKYVDGMHCMNPKSAYLWTAEDTRFDATFMTTMYNAEQGEWGNKGYYAYYNAPNEALDTMPICMRIFPGTVSTSVVNSYTAEHANQLKKGSCVNEVMVIHMTYPNMKVNGSNQDFLEYVVNPGMFAAPVVKKFDDPNSDAIATNKTNGYRDIVLLHASDIYLVAAEAALMCDDKNAAEHYLNAVRTRSNTTEVTFASYSAPYKNAYSAFTQTDIDLVLDERARELYAEGHRWMDLRRTKQLVRYNNIFNKEIAGHAESSMANVQGEYKWYKPIPQAEINANEALTEADQNTGY